MNLNRVFILGRLTADPQLRSTSNGTQVATFSLATNRVWKDAAGAKKESTEYHNIVVWGRQAEIASRFLVKGALAFIEGRMQTRDWEGRDGQKRRTTEVVCERMQLGPRPGGFKPASSADPANGAGGASVQDNAGGQASPGEVPIIDVSENEEEIKSEDLPF